MDSVDSNVDLELMAAFIEGRLSGEERARAVKLLAESDDALELFANALRQQQETADVKVVPISTARRWRTWRTLVPLAAAAVLAIVMVPRLAGRRTPAVFANQYAMELSQDPHFAGLRDGWEHRTWSVTRGVPSGAPGTRPTGSAAESKLAFRLGARSVDLQVALRRGDTALADGLTGEVVQTLSGVAFSESVQAHYSELKSRVATDTPARLIDRASDVEHELRDLLGSPPSFSFGQWVAAAELAARAHDASFFESTYGIRFIQSASPAGSLGSDDVEALRSIETRMKEGTNEDTLDEVDEVLQTIIRRRGG